MSAKHNTRRSLLLLFLIICISSLFAQNLLTFRVVDFSYDVFDQTARDERFKKIDGSGFLYAIVKVSGDSPADKLSEYRFNFGNMNHIVENHDGELWLYVQKNAKMVTISRSGYATLHHYDLNTTIESGKTYRMKLSAQAAKVYTQMVMFTITPADSKAMVTVTKEGGEQKRKPFGTVDETGGVAKNLEYGTYIYEIIAENYYSSEGRFTLDNQDETHVEKINLRPITGILSISSHPLGANIQIDGKDYGTTPHNIHDLLIGHHIITVSKDGYVIKKEECIIRENEQLSLELTLEKTADKTFTVGGVSFTMKKVAGGTFTMGATSEQGSDADNDETPTHKVTLDDYYIGETEVTQELWQAVMGKNPSKLKGSNLPVEQVSWNDCQEFVRRLNAQTGQKFHLPTEAEWEYAARGGQNSQGYKYSGSNNLDDVAWYDDNSSSTHTVKTKQPNELGIYDMSGNVWEWCNDWYGSYNNNAQTNPVGPLGGSNRVRRGGSWYDNARGCRVSYRSNFTPDYRINFLGLRLALDVQK